MLSAPPSHRPSALPSACKRFSPHCCATAQNSTVHQYPGTPARSRSSCAHPPRPVDCDSGWSESCGSWRLFCCNRSPSRNSRRSHVSAPPSPAIARTDSSCSQMRRAVSQPASNTKSAVSAVSSYIQSTPSLSSIGSVIWRTLPSAAATQLPYLSTAP